MAGLSLGDFKELLATPAPPELGPGPRGAVKPEVTLRLALDQRLAGTKLAPDVEPLVRALIYLWHDHMDAAHEISQDVPSGSGSFVHGIVHRREPDYGNAQYWFRRVGTHPAFEPLAAKVEELPEMKAETKIHAKLITSGRWNAMGMIAACEEATRSGADAQIMALREVQRLEIESLLEWLLDSSK